MYAKTIWKDEISEHPYRYNEQANSDGSVDHIPNYGRMIQEGTPVNADNLNKMEEGIYQAHEFIRNNEDIISSNTVNILALAIAFELYSQSAVAGTADNLFVETFENDNEIMISSGIYDSANKRMYA